MRSCSGIPLPHRGKSSLLEPDAQCQRWKQLLRWFISYCNVGTWRTWVSPHWINPGDFLIPRTMNLGGLHRIRSKGIHKHCIIDCYRLHMCHDHHQNTRKGCQGIVFCADDEAYHVVNNGLISPPISSISCNQLLTCVVSILSLLNIYISDRIQSFNRLIRYLLGCQQRRLTSILLLWDNIDLPMLKI